MRASRLLPIAIVLAVAGFTLLPGRCRVDERQPVRVEEGRVVVTNLTSTSWSEVDVWLNDVYRAQARSLEPGQRLEIPLGVFVAAFGRPFDPSRQAPVGVEVAARVAGGGQVLVAWGRGRRR